MSRHDDLIERAAESAGIAAVYKNAVGMEFITSHESKRIVLAALGFETDTLARTADSLDQIQNSLGKTIPSLIVAAADRPVEIILLSPLRGRHSIEWHLAAEDGTILEGRAALQRRSGNTILELAPLAAGYYRFILYLDKIPARTTLIVAPDHCWQPDWLNSETRAWGITAQTYGLRREQDFGIGDFTTVGQAARAAGHAGAAFLGLSPLHALFTSDRRKFSPYSPSSRLFLETIYIDPCAVRYFADSKAAQLFFDTSFQKQLSKIQQNHLIDYAGVWLLKQQMLELLWKEFSSRGVQEAFLTFRETGGESLDSHALFETLSEYFLAQNRSVASMWPPAFRDLQSREISQFKEQHADRIAFHAWLQWLADTQFEAAARSARDAKLEIGLYRDLAVGADGEGSEVWANPQRFARGLSIGAPPDALSPKGQDWGLPPFHPLVLRSDSLAAFRDLVTANMRHAGAIRIDHAFQLRRLFLIPSGIPSALGTYVDYPFEALLAVLRIESHRAKCLVIGEDFGNPPELFSETIMDSGIFGYRVVPFERKSDGKFKRPSTYPHKTLAVISTHDLPTLKGWWRGFDVDLRECFGVYDANEAERERRIREDECRFFDAALKAEGLPASTSIADAPRDSACRFLAHTNSVLTGVQFEDVLGALNQANLPGLADGHPNWRRRLDQTIETMARSGGLLRKVGALFADERRGLRIHESRLAAAPPHATYRLQFHKGFTFDDAIAILPYLSTLGISHVYASPIQSATPGSMHGYDIVDPTRINPELGGSAGFERFADALRANSLSLLLDIVPNHMGIAGSANEWWQSVLEWGEDSPYAETFDIDWNRPGADHKLILPVLGAPLGETLDQGLFKLKFDSNEGCFRFFHGDDYFPIRPIDYSRVLSLAATFLAPKEAASLSPLMSRLRSLGEPSEKGMRQKLVERGTMLKRSLADLSKTSALIANSIAMAVDHINGKAEIVASFDVQRSLLDSQIYRLTYWRDAASALNYRRFFDIQSLVGVNVENPEVFSATHALIFKLFDENKVQGLRVDHIDGLAYPESYLQRLQSALGPGCFVIAEKILEPGEALRKWPIAGTTGYDSLNLLDNIFITSDSETRFNALYHEFTGSLRSYETMLHEAKLDTIRNSFPSEVENLVLDLDALAKMSPSTSEIPPQELSRSLIEIIAAFPVYRSYIGNSGPSSEDRSIITDAVTQAGRASPPEDMAGYDFIRSALLAEWESDERHNSTAVLRRFRKRFQQLTGPVMAKSLEDTLFYRFSRFIVLNEVGGDPGQFGMSPAKFHVANRQRCENHPNTMIASATHDTKRGEDTRARLLALSSMPDEWASALASWRDCVAALDPANAGPDADDQYFLFQTILGAWPTELLDRAASDNLASFGERLKAYMLKALRESKRRSNWTDPNLPYEKATFALIDALMSESASFIRTFQPLAQRLAFQGMLISLARLVLKCTLPGFPDIYQGTELWDLSLVDPDNRRPVDYDLRQALAGRKESMQDSAKNWRNGRIKQLFLTRLLDDRHAAPELYAWGDYRPIETGRQSSPIVAFHRVYAHEELMVATLRHPGRKFQEPVFPMMKEAFAGVELPLPTGRWRNLLTGTTFVSHGRIEPADHFEGLPAIALRKTG